MRFAYGWADQLPHRAGREYDTGVAAEDPQNEAPKRDSEDAPDPKDGFWTWFPRSATYAALVSALAALTGLLGTLHTAEIRSVFPFRSIGFGPIQQEAVYFWLCLAAASLLYGRRQFVVDRDRKTATDGLQQATARLQDQSRDIATLVQTMPPASFLQDFEQDYTKCADITYRLFVGDESVRSKETIDAAIVTVLTAMAGLAYSYDGQPKRRTGEDVEPVQYAANVMIFVSESDIPEKPPADWHIGFMALLHFLWVDVAAHFGVPEGLKGGSGKIRGPLSGSFDAHERKVAWEGWRGVERRTRLMLSCGC